MSHSGINVLTAMAITFEIINRLLAFFYLSRIHLIVPYAYFELRLCFRCIHGPSSHQNLDHGSASGLVLVHFLKNKLEIDGVSIHLFLETQYGQVLDICEGSGI